MKRMDYIDNNGKRYTVIVPDNATADDAAKGVVIGPPNLALDLPEDLDRELHNQLHSRGIFTLRDALRRREEVNNAVRAAFKLSIERVLTAYQLAEASVESPEGANSNG